MKKGCCLRKIIGLKTHLELIMTCTFLQVTQSISLTNINIQSGKDGVI